LDIQKEKGKKLKDFKTGLKESQAIKELNTAVNQFAMQFDIPGFDANSIE
jgi:hypothetical protein